MAKETILSLEAEVAGSPRDALEGKWVILLCCHEKNRQLFVKENLRLRVFLVNQFMAATAEKTTMKAQISYESFVSLVKLFKENYPDQTVTFSFQFVLMSKSGWLILHVVVKAKITDLHSVSLICKRMAHISFLIFSCSYLRPSLLPQNQSCTYQKVCTLLCTLLNCQYSIFSPSIAIIIAILKKKKKMQLRKQLWHPIA